MRNIYKKLIIFFVLLAIVSPNGVSLGAQGAIEPVKTTIAIIPDKFTVSLNLSFEQIVQNLFDQNFIKNKEDFISVFSKTKGDIAPGAYKINQSMTIGDISKVLHAKPYMKWVVIPPGLRKEEIAEILATNLGWSKLQKSSWINIYTRMKYDYVEGVYFPDTYLIPVAESPLAVSKRLVAKFNEKFGPYLLRFKNQNMQWTKGIILASIVQREASSDADMPLIAGILLNRLNQKIPLSVDATLQYIRGNKGLGWWAPLTTIDKKNTSAFNTYKYKGLPPRSISNPGIPAIEAVLNPTKTDCIYYLHDKDRVTHCAVTYDEHKANIEKYLK
jgi:UPF0755 protein